MKWICFANFLFSSMIALTIDALAAPHPGMGSSRLSQARLPLRVSSAGFELKAPEFWLAEPHFDSKAKSVDYSSKSKPTAQFQVRWESLKSSPSIETYAKKWMKDYNNYGFEILGTKTFEDKGGKGLVVDLKHPQYGKIQRQVIYLNGKKVVVLSCTDTAAEFNETLKDCNEAIRGFSWAQEPTTTK